MTRLRTKFERIIQRLANNIGFIVDTLDYLILEPVRKFLDHEEINEVEIVRDTKLLDVGIQWCKRAVIFVLELVAMWLVITLYDYILKLWWFWLFFFV